MVRRQREAPMGTYVALFRSVNVGGRAVVSSAALRGVAAAAGLGAAHAVLQSGNLVFSARAATSAALEAALEAAAAERLRLQTDVLVRSAADWLRIVDANPFPSEAVDDPSHLLVMPLKGSTTPGRVRVLQEAIKGRERVMAAGAELYLVYPDGIGRSTLTTRVVEASLATRGTARNWNTVLRLRALLDAV